MVCLLTLIWSLIALMVFKITLVIFSKNWYDEVIDIEMYEKWLYRWDALIDIIEYIEHPYRYPENKV